MSDELCIHTASLVLSKKDSEAVGRNDYFIESLIPSTEAVLFLNVLANKVCGYHVNLVLKNLDHPHFLVGRYLSNNKLKELPKGVFDNNKQLVLL